MELETYGRAKFTAELDAYESISRPVGTRKSWSDMFPVLKDGAKKIILCLRHEGKTILLFDIHGT